MKTTLASLFDLNLRSVVGTLFLFLTLLFGAVPGLGQSQPHYPSLGDIDAGMLEIKDLGATWDSRTNQWVLHLEVSNKLAIYYDPFIVDYPYCDWKKGIQLDRIPGKEVGFLGSIKDFLSKDKSYRHDFYIPLNYGSTQGVYLRPAANDEGWGVYNIYISPLLLAGLDEIIDFLGPKAFNKEIEQVREQVNEKIYEAIKDEILPIAGKVVTTENVMEVLRGITFEVMKASLEPVIKWDVINTETFQGMVEGVIESVMIGKAGEYLFKAFNYAVGIWDYNVYDFGYCFQIAVTDNAPKFTFIYPNNNSSFNLYGSSVTLEWNAWDVDGDELQFNVFLRQRGESEFKQVNGSLINQNSFVLKGLTDGQYEFRIQAKYAPPLESLSKNFVSEIGRFDVMSQMHPDIPALLEIEEVMQTPFVYKGMVESGDNYPCNWPGIGCNNLLRVNMIQLSSIGGELPKALNQLEFLEVIEIDGNGGIEGEISDDYFSNLEYLQRLRINDTRAIGLLPSLKNNLKLEEIELSGNSFTGSLPESWADLPNLNSIDVRNNDLSGCISNKFADFKAAGNTFRFAEGNAFNFSEAEFFSGDKGSCERAACQSPIVTFSKSACTNGQYDLEVKLDIKDDDTFILTPPNGTGDAAILKKDGNEAVFGPFTGDGRPYYFYIESERCSSKVTRYAGYTCPLEPVFQPIEVTWPNIDDLCVEPGGSYMITWEPGTYQGQVDIWIYDVHNGNGWAVKEKVDNIGYYNWDGTGSPWSTLPESNYEIEIRGRGEAFSNKSRSDYTLNYKLSCSGGGCEEATISILSPRPNSAGVVEVEPGELFTIRWQSDVTCTGDNYQIVFWEDRAFPFPEIPMFGKNTYEHSFRDEGTYFFSVKAEKNGKTFESDPIKVVVTNQDSPNDCFDIYEPNDDPVSQLKEIKLIWQNGKAHADVSAAFCVNDKDYFFVGLDNSKEYRLRTDRDIYDKIKVDLTEYKGYSLFQRQKVSSGEKDDSGWFSTKNVSFIVFEIFPKNSGEGDYSFSIDVEDLTDDQDGKEDCGVPKNVRVESVGTNSVTFRWDGTSDFFVNYKIDEVGSTVRHGTIETGNYEKVENLNPNTSYDLRVKFSCADQYSAPIPFKTNGCNTTYYQDRDGDGYGDARYTQKACEEPEGYVLNAQDCDDSDRNINPGASEGCDDIDNNCNGQVDEDCGVQCDIPSGVKTEINHEKGEILLFWDRQEADLFEIEYKQPGGSLNRKSTTRNEYAFGFKYNRTYLIKVRALCDGQLTEYSQEISVTPLPIGDCPAPSGLQVLETKNTLVVLTWNEKANLVKLNYRLKGQTSWNAYGNYLGVSDENTIYFRNMEPGETYQIRIQQVCENDQLSNWSNTLEASLNTCNEFTYYPDNDQDGYGDNSQGQKSCEPIEGYITQGGDCDDNNFFVHPDATEYCDGVDNDCDGQVDESCIISCQQPWSLKESVNDAGETAILTWNGGSEAEKFQLEMQEVGNVWIRQGNTAISQYELNVDPGETWQWRVRSDCGNSLTDWSAWRTFTVTEICNAPADTRIIKTEDGKITVGWTYDERSVRFRYRIQGTSQWQTLGGVNGIGVDNGAYTIRNLLNNQPYEIQIAIICDAGSSPWSASLVGIIQLEEGCEEQTYYRDRDEDGFGDPATEVLACDPLQGFVMNNGDCDDYDPSIYPGADEYCDDIDNDCNSQVDDNCTARCATPTDLTVTLDEQNNRVHLFWSESGDLFNVELQRDNDAVRFYSQAATDLNISLAPEVTLRWRVRSTCDGFLSDWSEWQEYSYSADCGMPEQISGSDIASSRATIKWLAQDNPVELRFREKGKTAWDLLGGAISGDGGYYTLRNLSDRVEYEVSLRTKCKYGYSDWSDPVFVKPEPCEENTYYRDLDNDGYGDDSKSVQACEAPVGYVVTGGDCNDRDRTIYPGATDICDGKDNDCDGIVDPEQVKVYRDFDGDGYGDARYPLFVCNIPFGFVENKEDCDDYDAGIHPGAEDICDGIDNDCDGQIDEDPVFLTYYYDADGDGYGNSNISLEACEQPTSYVLRGGDCFDKDEKVNPGATEVCDGIDNDCDGQIDEGLTFKTYYVDKDGDGYGISTSSTSSCKPLEGYALLAGDCDDSNDNVYPGSKEICDNLDNDCNELIDDGAEPITFYRDWDGDGYGNSGQTRISCEPPPGYVARAGDCNDRDRNIHPGASEICDGKDNDCNGEIDEGLSTSIYYRDADGDGYGNPSQSIVDCKKPGGYVARAGDCNDSNSAVYPGAIELCDNLDNDCDGDIDEGVATLTYYRDADGDGYGNSSQSVIDCSRPSGYALQGGDCNDNDSSIHPGASESCDGKDNDCNNQIDDGVTINTYYRDADGDGYGNSSNSVQDCSAPNGYVSNNTDCNDGNANIHPGATEACDGVDNNCNSQTDEGCAPVCTPEVVPSPQLIFDSWEDTGSGMIKYSLSVPNASSIPNELFESAPHLPPCGINPNASRTFVDIYTGDGSHIYGFCGLGSSAGLNSIWFAWPASECPPNVYIELEDRECDRIFLSNTIAIPCPPIVNKFVSEEVPSAISDEIKEFLGNRNIYRNGDWIPSLSGNIAEHKLKLSEIMLVPNPTTDRFTIYFENGFNQNTMVELYYINGKQIGVQELQKGVVEYQFGEELLPGIYFLRFIQAGEFIGFKRIIKQ